MDGKYQAGLASLFAITARGAKPAPESTPRNQALEACEQLVDLIGECPLCYGRGKYKLHDGHLCNCPYCGGRGVVIESVEKILTKVLPLALDALDADNKPFEDFLRRLFHTEAHWVGQPLCCCLEREGDNDQCKVHGGNGGR